MGPVTALALGVACTLVSLPTLALAVPALRRRLVARPLLARFRRTMPPMSPTEREAMEAGGTWWDAELFGGRPRWDRLLDLPPARLTDEEQAFLEGPVDRLCRMLDDWRIVQEEMDLPPEVWAFLKRERLFGLVIPKEYGGLGFSHYAHSQTVMRIASRSLAAAVTVMVPSSLGPAELLLRYGTEAQRRRWLPRLARGDEIPCFALTGPKAGSDAASTPDCGTVCVAETGGRRTLAIRIDFDKRYITLAPVATLIGLAFRLLDPERLLGPDPEPGITLALVPADTPGIERGRRHLPLGIPFQNGPIVGRDVLIPIDWVVGGHDGVGKGWRMLMECLAEGRGISLPALSTGAAKLAARTAGAYGRVRRQFGRPIGDFEGVEAALARIAGRTLQMDSARRVLLAALDAGERPAVLSAVLKYHLTERYRLVIADAMDVLGGSGICLGPSNLLGRVHQAIPIAITVEGANILTRCLIVFGQGALRCHPYLREELDAAQDPDPALALARFDRVAAAHARHLAGNLTRAIWLGLVRGRTARSPRSGALAHWYRRIGWLSAAFAVHADLTLMTLGGELKRRERLSARLGDALSLLFLASTVLKEHEDRGRPAADLALVDWALEDHLRGVQEALAGLWRNLPNQALAWALRLLTFPTGLPFAGPTDRQDHRVARLILEPGPSRDRLTEGIYRSRDPGEPAGRLDLALEAAVRAEPVERILREAAAAGTIPRGDGAEAVLQALHLHLIRQDDAAAMTSAERLREAVIAVDSFADLRPTASGRAPAAGFQRDAA